MQYLGATMNLDFEQDETEPGSGWSLSKFLIGFVGLVALIAVPTIGSTCQLDPFAWIRGEGALCGASAVSVHNARTGSISRKYNGGDVLREVDSINVYARKGERIEFTYSATVSRGAIVLSLQENQTFRRARGGETLWSSGYMEKSSSEELSVTASRMGVYYFMIEPALSAEGSIDLSWEVN